LDTWFSSALWPFAGLSAADLKKYYPGSALITARDILNLWVARMIFSGLEFREKVPFNKVFINGTILTKEGKRMSKSKGTGVDPLNYIDRFGADATRFGIVLKAAGQDIRWDESALEAGKKFANKTWNIARFIFMNRPSAADLSAAVLTQEDRKNLNNLKQVKKQIAKHLEKFEFHLAVEKLYRYIWHEFADKIIEAAKPRLRSENRADKAAASKTIETILYESLKMLHPFMPYVTEEIYQNLPFRKEKTIMIERW
jgi:valyl-tRNA synthetase